MRVKYWNVSEYTVKFPSIETYYFLAKYVLKRLAKINKLQNKKLKHLLQVIMKLY